MNPTEDGLIEVGHSVRREEHDPLTVFDLAKEYRDKLITSDVVLRALFQIHVRFVQ